MVLRYFLVTTFLPPQGSFQGSSDLLSLNSEALAGHRDSLSHFQVAGSLRFPGALPTLAGSVVSLLASRPVAETR